MNNISPQFALLILIVGGGFFLFIYVRDQMTKAELRRHGVTTTARVLSRHHEIQTHQSTNSNNVPTTSTSDSYSISYQYTVNGTSYNGSDTVDVSVYDALQEGQPVEVVYLPESPGQARLASSL